MREAVPGGIEQLATEVLRRANHRRDRGPQHGGPHFVRDRDQSAPHDLKANGIVGQSGHVFVVRVTLI